MILEFLPQDILEEFRCECPAYRECRRSPYIDNEDPDDYSHSWCPWKPFSADNLLLLYKKQRKMKWLEVRSCST